jgi:hypothetical protein
MPKLEKRNENNAINTTGKTSTSHENKSPSNEKSWVNLLIVILLIAFIILIILMVFILTNYLKKKKLLENISLAKNNIFKRQNLNKSANKNAKNIFLPVLPSDNLSFNQVLNNIITTSKIRGTFDKYKICNAEMQKYFQEKIKKEDNKTFQIKLVDAFNKPSYSASDTVDSETHNILLRLSGIPIVMAKPSGIKFSSTENVQLGVGQKDIESKSI